jgi:hypothetical protein
VIGFGIVLVSFVEVQQGENIAQGVPMCGRVSHFVAAAFAAANPAARSGPRAERGAKIVERAFARNRIRRFLRQS